MIPIISGVRYYGDVRGCGGQHIATRFVHLYFLPLIPLGSMWVTGEEEREEKGLLGKKKETVTVGVEIPFHFLSAFMGYLRTWMLLFSVISFFQGRYLLGVSLIVASVISILVTGVYGAKANRQKLFGAQTGLYCDPDILPRDTAARMLEQLLPEWRARHGNMPPESFTGEVEKRCTALHYAVLRLTARTTQSARARELAEALFQKVVWTLMKQRHPDAPAVQRLAQRQSEQEAQLRQEPAHVLEGTLGAFSEAHTGTSAPLVLAWYQQSQWERLREASADAGDLPSTYAAWLQEASQLIAQPHLRVRTVDMDVDELLRAASEAHVPVDRRFRTDFIHQKARTRAAA
ncbi:hypothetical protein HPC49_50105 [Pyxidicoccus fallax]|uniref:Uncharacterized protein n=1 Tax=Pyxidicoccus fallax TaxID=394095 RepID=A0A848LEX6_9BACT|nr:hypothetical protein [Pyxidicoccus fallax]NMO14058.1 hypothetical protein [Pyxidicoccus fallax]NPC86328.1 hypothetical protein [Pyxidicoccus fallax]